MAKILVVEDDIELCGVIEDWLISENHSVEVICNGNDAADRLQYGKYDIAILDWDLPDVQGIDILRNFRSAGGSIPVLILTGKITFHNRIEGLDAGADDYLTKPFDLGELSARVRALMRRPAHVTPKNLRAGDIELQTDTGRVFRAETELQLLPKEHALLEFFMRHPNQLFSSEDLIKRIWPTDSNLSTDTIKTHINRLRKKLDIDGLPSVLRTVHGFGYKLEIEIKD